MLFLLLSVIACLELVTCFIVLFRYDHFTALIVLYGISNLFFSLYFGMCNLF